MDVEGPHPRRVGSYIETTTVNPPAEQAAELNRENAVALKPLVADVERWARNNAEAAKLLFPAWASLYNAIDAVTLPAGSALGYRSCPVGGLEPDIGGRLGYVRFTHERWGNRPAGLWIAEN